LPILVKRRFDKRLVREEAKKYVRINSLNAEDEKLILDAIADAWSKAPPSHPFARRNRNEKICFFNAVLVMLHAACERMNDLTACITGCNFGKLLVEAIQKDEDSVKRRVLQAINVDPDIQNDAAEVYEKVLEKLLEELPAEKKDILKKTFFVNAVVKTSCLRCKASISLVRVILPTIYNKPHHSCKMVSPQLNTPEEVKENVSSHCLKCMGTKLKEQIEYSQMPRFPTFVFDRGTKTGNKLKYKVQLSTKKSAKVEKQTFDATPIASVVHLGQTITNGHYTTRAEFPTGCFVVNDEDVTKTDSLAFKAISDVTIAMYEVTVLQNHVVTKLSLNSSRQMINGSGVSFDDVVKMQNVQELSEGYWKGQGRGCLTCSFTGPNHIFPYRVKQVVYLEDSSVFDDADSSTLSSERLGENPSSFFISLEGEPESFLSSGSLGFDV
jgi:hypothetical protein